jgi:hypothetical protein
MDSPLGTPELLASVEKHVAACQSCSEELKELEELGLAFAESALEDPPEEHFASYGNLVRHRVRRMTRRTTIQPGVTGPVQWRTWLSTVAASAAAAVLTVILLNPATPNPATDGSEVAKAEPAPVVRHEMKGDVAEKTDTQTPKIPSAGVIRASEGSAMPVLPNLESGNLRLMLWGEDGARDVVVNPKTDMSGWRRIVLGDSSKALVGIAFAADERTVPEGLRVVAVKRGGVADAIGLRPDDRLLALNGMSFANSSPEQIVKFFNAVSSLGRGKLIQVDFARKHGDDWLIKRGRGELGKFE